MGQDSFDWRADAIAQLLSQGKVPVGVRRNRAGAMNGGFCLRFMRYLKYYTTARGCETLVQRVNGTPHLVNTKPCHTAKYARIKAYDVIRMACMEFHMSSGLANVRNVGPGKDG
tara:strand:+ start:646 stop:987 length:342 start_codon:yes stop_codon:yes gene_type:complete